MTRGRTSFDSIQSSRKEGPNSPLPPVLIPPQLTYGSRWQLSELSNLCIFNLKQIIGTKLRYEARLCSETEVQISNGLNETLLWPMPSTQSLTFRHKIVEAKELAPDLVTSFYPSLARALLTGDFLVQYRSLNHWMGDPTHRPEQFRTLMLLVFLWVCTSAVLIDQEEYKRTIVKDSRPNIYSLYDLSVPQAEWQILGWADLWEWRNLRSQSSSRHCWSKLLT